jgi:ATP-dependent exoDNAse (exonuclease V) beta subunit
MEAPTKQDLLNILSTYSGRIEFNEKEHTYFVDAKKYPSVSSVMKLFVPDFPERFMAKQVADKRRMTNKFAIDTTDSVLAEWKHKKDKAAAYGNLVHYGLEKYCEKYTNKQANEISIDYALLDEEDLNKASIAVSNGAKWLENKLKSGYTLIDTEVRMFNKALGFTGTLDLLLMKGNKLVVADWKSNLKDITSDSYNNYLKAPLSTLKATTLNKYKVQLNMYKILLEGILPLKVDELIVVHTKPIEGALDEYYAEDYSNLLLEVLK